MTRRRRIADSPQYGPCCGMQLEYVGFYRCPSCKMRVEMRDIARLDQAGRIREKRGRAAVAAGGQSEGAAGDRLF